MYGGGEAIADASSERSRGKRATRALNSGSAVWPTQQALVEPHARRSTRSWPPRDKGLEAVREADAHTEQVHKGRAHDSETQPPRQQKRDDHDNKAARLGGRLDRAGDGAGGTGGGGWVMIGGGKSADRSAGS